MANNPVMRNATRNVDAYALLVQITRAVISAVTHLIVSYRPSEISAVGFRMLAYGYCRSIPQELYL